MGGLTYADVSAETFNDALRSTIGLSLKLPASFVTLENVVVTINPPERRLRASASTSTSPSALDGVTLSDTALPEITVKYILRVAGGEAPKAMAFTLNGAMQSGSFLTEMKTSYPEDEITIRGSFSELVDATESPTLAPTGIPTLSPTPEGTPLHCTVLHCTALRCNKLYWTVMHHITLQCTVLYYHALSWTTLHCIASHCTALYSDILHCTALYCIDGPQPSSFLFYPVIKSRILKLFFVSSLSLVPFPPLFSPPLTFPPPSSPLLSSPFFSSPFLPFLLLSLLYLRKMFLSVLITNTPQLYI